MSSEKALKFLLFGEDRTASKAFRKVEGEAKTSTDKIGSSFKHVGGMIAGAFAGGAALEFFKGAYDATEKLDKADKLTGAVLKSTGGAAHVSASQVDGLARSISAKVGIDHVAIQSGENLLLTFQNVRNETGKGNDVFNQGVQAATDMSVALGTKLTGATRMVGRALNDPIKGLTALTRVGVSFTAGQKKQITAMVASGNVMGAQKLILAQLNQKFAGAAASQVTPAMKAKVAWTNFKETIGGAVMPIATKLFNFFSNDIAPALRSVAGWVKNNSGLFKTLGLVLVPLLAAWVAYAGYMKIAAIAQGAWTLATTIGTGVMDLFGASTAVATGEMTALDGAMDANPIGLVVAAIALLGAGMVILWKKSATFRHIVEGVFHAVATAGQYLWNNALKPAFNGVKAGFTFVSTVISGAWNNVIKPVFGFFGSVFRGVGKVIGTVAGAIGTVFHGIGTALSTAWGVISGIYDGIKSGIHAVGRVIGTVVGVIKSLWGHIGDGLKWAYDHIIKPILDSITASIQGVKDALNALNPFKGIDGKGIIAKFLATHPGAAGATPYQPPHNATGGTAADGWGISGENGTEVYHKSGNQVQFFSHAASGPILARANRPATHAPPVQQVDMTAVVRKLDELTRAVLGMHIELDGQKIGRVMGRRADRYARGG